MKQTKNKVGRAAVTAPGKSTVQPQPVSAAENPATDGRDLTLAELLGIDLESPATAAAIEGASLAELLGMDLDTPASTPTPMAGPPRAGKRPATAKAAAPAGMHAMSTAQRRLAKRRLERPLLKGADSDPIPVASPPPARRKQQPAKTAKDRSAVEPACQPPPKSVRGKSSCQGFNSVTPGLLAIQKALDDFDEYSSLVRASPMPRAEMESHDARYYIRKLFPENNLMCLGKSYRDVLTLNRNSLLKHLPTSNYVVPAFMSAREGMTSTSSLGYGKIPHLSPRCNSNTGPLRYVVYRNKRADLNDQARAVIRLARCYRLAMVVKADPCLLEAWFPVEQGNIHSLQAAAMKLGASWKTTIACRFYSLPQGGSEYSRKVVYFDPSALLP